MRVVRDPFVHFLVLGAMIFAAYGVVRPAEERDGTARIVVDGAVQASLYANFRKQFGRLPSQAEMEAVVSADVTHELKYREALALGLDEGDSIVRRRMMQKFDFLYGNGAVGTTPEPGVLEAWYEERLGDYAAPAQVDFEQVWFSPDRRGAAAESDARGALARVSEGETPTGDVFPGARQFASAEEWEVRAAFGERFARSVFEAPVGVWSGPIASGLGFHLVYVNERAEESARSLEEIREAVLEDWGKWESERIVERLIEEMLSRYRIEIDEATLAEFEYGPE